MEVLTRGGSNPNIAGYVESGGSGGRGKLMSLTGKPQDMILLLDRPSISQGFTDLYKERFSTPEHKNVLEIKAEVKFVTYVVIGGKAIARMDWSSVTHLERYRREPGGLFQVVPENDKLRRINLSTFSGPPTGVGPANQMLPQEFIDLANKTQPGSLTGWIGSTISRPGQ